MNPRATERDGILEIRRVTAADAGRYRCTVTSNAGTLDGYAIVDVEGLAQFINVKPLPLFVLIHQMKNY